LAPSELVIAISPYHLTGRELAAVASIQIADRVVTILPGAASRAGSERAARELPRYRRLVERWAWGEPLLRAGVVSPAWEGDDPLADVRAVVEMIETEDRWAALRPLMRPALLEDERAMIEGIASDLLRGGPDPGLLVPISAAIDRFAARHGLCVARSAARSIAQKAETRMATRLGAFALPLIGQAEPERLLEARELIAEGAAPLRDEIAALGERVASRGPEPLADEEVGRLDQASRAMQSVLADRQSALTRCDDPLDLAVRISTVSVSLEAMPTDAVLRSSAAAAGALGGVAGVGSEAAGAIVRAPAERPWVLSLVIRAIGGGR
jgi:hypothetical protein